MRIPLHAKFRFASLTLAAVLLAACHGDGSDGDAGNEECFAGSGKGQVLDIMRTWYLWNDQAEQFNKYRFIDQREFADADDLLDFLRYRPQEFDRGFSYITTPEEEAAFFDEGEFVGFGIGLAQIGNDIYFSQIYAGSPAATVGGFQRGYRLLEIDGRGIEQILADEGLNEALGPAEAGFSLTFTVADAAGVELPPVELSKAVVTIDPVPVVGIINDGGGNPFAGYILFNTFITSASSQLRAAFAQLGADNITNVVIDLRYNGGGLVSVSAVLASLLAGDGHAGQVYADTTFNSARAQFNERTLFQQEANALTLDKIVFITSEGSASASELVINGLKPYFNSAELALVGSRTFGKPVGQIGFDFCGSEFRLRAVAFKSVNANGEGDYFDGLPVDCPAEDDLSHALGDPTEESLAVALEFLEGGCPISSAPGFGISRAAGKARPVTGPGLAQQYAGAF